ncbi:hypothetical protein EV379_3119 [Microterricola gilva]|uniref:Gp6-like head-tail connector protein n=1 Tax=Microterricola gilva TaxID=393267 RepID=A0A4Q8ARH8_9MICO|nr:hypothetical protein [Microterricola gilva]RZU66753.1 hypothetical protein EV379_3119 [Microterricola gilva]
MASADLITRLTDYVKADAHSVSSSDEKFIETCLDEAEALVSARVGTATVPTPILERAQIEVGSELYNRRSAPNGISQFSAPDGSAIRVARDPMVAAYPILQPYLPLGLA